MSLEGGIRGIILNQKHDLRHCVTARTSGILRTLADGPSVCHRTYDMTVKGLPVRQIDATYEGTSGRIAIALRRSPDITDVGHDV